MGWHAKDEDQGWTTVKVQLRRVSQPPARVPAKVLVCRALSTDVGLKIRPIPDGREL